MIRATSTGRGEPRQSSVGLCETHHAGATPAANASSPSTLRSLGDPGETSCQHALFFLRWLGRTPESFLAGAALHAGAPLPTCGPDRRPRWDLKALHAALNEARTRRGATWAQTAEDLRCKPGQLTGLKTARFATGMGLAMGVTQWVGRPAADFIYPARW